MRTILSSFFLPALVVSACSSSSGGDQSTSDTGTKRPAPEQACLDTADAAGKAGERCLVGYSLVHDRFINEAANGNCANVVQLRDEASLRNTCIPSLATASCGDLAALNVDASCKNQFITSTGDAGGGAPADSGAFISLTPCANPSDYTTGATTVQFGDSLVYEPKCLTVGAGTSVTFSGSFSTHPLTPSTRGTPGSPIVATTSSTSATFIFTSPGFYPYYCGVHGSDSGSGMAGVVQVTP